MLPRTQAAIGAVCLSLGFVPAIGQLFGFW